MLNAWQGSKYGSGYGSLLETKKFMVLNSVIKNKTTYWALLRNNQLDRPHKKQFSLLGKFSLFFINKKSQYLRNTLKIFFLSYLFLAEFWMYLGDAFLQIIF